MVWRESGPPSASRADHRTHGVLRRVSALGESREVRLGLLGVVDHGLGSRLPVGGADLTVFVGVLEGRHEAQHLVHGAAHGEVVLYLKSVVC